LAEKTQSLEEPMARIVKSGLIQCSLPLHEGEGTVKEIKDAMFEKHLSFIDEAGKKGVQILCLQEIFNTPYFCPSQDSKWYRTAEKIPEGPTTQTMMEYAKKWGMAIVVPIYEEPMTGVYYNTAAVIDADGKYLGKYRKNHIPQLAGFWEKFYFKPGNLGYPTFQTQFAKIGVYICYDRHFPEGARLLALNGAEIVYNPSATVAGLSQYLWKLEQPAHAAANGMYMGNINRVGVEKPWNLGKFYGTSYFVDPRGQIVAEASEDNDELLIADLDMDKIQETRDAWQFFRDRRPETYDNMVKLLP
jgi:beta-ureidopropionase